MLVRRRRRRFLTGPRLKDRLRGDRVGRDDSLLRRPRFEVCYLLSRRGNCLSLGAERAR